ncbi:hypothetical protein SUGI_0265040 [Cryptomeria japonica]|uniref:tRNase Z TRZ3, mitochondrial n=1 Tax=Cryptomeria japonica TaxID=3369 RepID=UPI0024089AEF|nr:tRNase Z TRZ3, mitochondrial [Cryptomeria japonica]GLJ16002.1 hypothetical protein SUGI_0265040 [Cryptomeria japonica]
MAHLNSLLQSALRPLQNTAPFSPLKSLLKKPTKSIFQNPEIHSVISIKLFSRVVFAATGGRGRGSGHLKQYKRGISVRKEGSTGVRKRSSEMDEEEPKDYNKKRMEGLDKAGPKQVKLKTRNINPVNTIAYVQILGTGMDTHDTSPSVLLFFDHQRFIFNAGEGIQRFFTEHKLKLSRLDHIFLTRVCSETAGGLPGLLLTMAGIGDNGMTVNMWGPSDLEYLLDAMRLFIPNSAVIHTHSFGPRHESEGSEVPQTSHGSISTQPIVLYKDELVQISAVLLLPSGVGRHHQEMEVGIEVSEGTNNDTGKNMESTPKRPRLGSEASSKIAGTAMKLQENYEPGDIAVVYICELPDIKGKFDPSKARALGLKPGPKYRELQLGKSVMSDTGDAMVHPSDVLGPSFPGPIVLFVDCPTISHFPDLLSAPVLSKFFTRMDDGYQNIQKHVSCFVHLSPSSVTKCPEYVEWMSKFVGAQHIMAGHELKNTGYPILKSSARLSTRLNFLCPQLFPVPGFRSLGVANTLEGASAQTSQDEDMMFHGFVLADNLLKFYLRPYARLGLDQSSVPSLPSASDIIGELVLEIPEIVDASKQIAQIWNSVPGEHNEYPNHTELHGPTFVEEPWITESTSISELELKVTNNGDAQKETQFKLPLGVNGCKGTEAIPMCLEGVSRDEMEIVFLGTGSSQPSKYRNVSSIFVNLFRKGGILLDCGEGTLAQLKRRFGVNGADDVIKSLKCIWISHIHADHHTGIARILSVRKHLLQNRSHESLLVIGPKPLRRFLNAYSRLEDLNMHFLDCRQTMKDSIDMYERIYADMQDEVGSGESSGSKQENSVVSNLVSLKTENREAPHSIQSQMQNYAQRLGVQDGTVLDLAGLHKLKKILSEAGIEVLHSVPVVHCREAFGVVLQAIRRKNNVNEIVPGWKLVYSGDTRPCKKLRDAAFGATVLIHEATFDDSMPEEAISKNHSLTKEAIEVGASAEAYRIILTHFSQRYPKIPVFDESYTDRTCIAFDLMTVNLADLPFVPKINSFLKLLFKNEMMAEESSEIDNMTENTAITL